MFCNKSPRNILSENLTRNPYNLKLISCKYYPKLPATTFCIICFQSHSRVNICPSATGDWLAGKSPASQRHEGFISLHKSEITSGGRGFIHECFNDPTGASRRSCGPDLLLQETYGHLREVLDTFWICSRGSNCKLTMRTDNENVRI